MKNLMLPSNIRIAMVAIRADGGKLPTDFYYIGKRFNQYIVTKEKDYAVHFEDLQRAQRALAVINNGRLDRYEIFLYTPEFNQDSLDFIDELDYLVSM